MSFPSVTSFFAFSSQKKEEPREPSRLWGVVTALPKALHYEGRRVYQFFLNHKSFFELNQAKETVLNAWRKKRKEGVSERGGPLLEALKAGLKEEERASFLGNPEELKAYSHLRTCTASLKIDEEAFMGVFDEAKRYVSAPLFKIVDFVKQTLLEKGMTCSKLSHIDEALSQEKQLRTILKKGKEGKEELHRLAQTLAQKTEALERGATFLTFSGVQHPKGFQSSIVRNVWEDILPKPVHPFLQGESSEELVKQLTESIATDLKKYTEITPLLLKRIEKGVRSSFQSATSILKDALPTFIYRKFKENLKEDLNDIVHGVIPKHSKGDLGRRIWDHLEEQGIEGSVETWLTSILDLARDGLDEKIALTTDKLLSALPEQAKDLFDASGLRISSEESIWLDIAKQSNGKIKVSLYARGRAAAPHLRGKVNEQKGIALPLTFSNVDPKRLDASFFYTLLSCRAHPLWDKKTDFSVDDFHKKLRTLLGQKPDAISKETFEPVPSSLREGIVDYLELYHLRSSDAPSSTIKRFYQYEIRLEMFKKMWAHVKEDKKYFKEHPKMVSELSKALSQLSKIGTELYAKNELSLEALKALYATVWEAEGELDAKKKQATPILSVITPPDFYETIKEIVLDAKITPSKAYLLKDALSIVYGSSVEAIVDEVIADVLPTLSVENYYEQKTKKKSRSYFHKIQSGVKDLKKIRVSLLHFYVLYRTINKFISKFFKVTLASRLIESFLSAYFPAISAHTSLSLATLSKLLAWFGPSLVKPLLPTPLYQTVSAIYHIAIDASKYVAKRIRVVVLRFLVRAIIGEERAAKLSQSAEAYHQKITRSGKVSYRLANGKNQKGYLLLKPDSTLLAQTEERDVTEDAEVNTLILPRPQEVEVNQENLYQQLSIWLADANAFPCKEDEQLDPIHSKRFLYLNRQFANLPLPRESPLWDQVEPIETMRLIQALIGKLRQSSRYGLSFEEHVEGVATLYSAYAIVDYLARRSQDAKLPKHLKGNGCDLALWFQNPTLIIDHPRIYERMRAAASYFGFDVNKDYTEKEIDQFRVGCLFNYGGKGQSFYRPQFASVQAKRMTPTYRGLMHTEEGQYYRTLLEDPEVQRRLRGCMVPLSASLWQQFLTLFENPEGYGGKPLPEAFSILREMDACARQFLDLSQLSGEPHHLIKARESWSFKRQIKEIAHFFTRHYFRRQDFNGYRDLGMRSLRFRHHHHLQCRYEDVSSKTPLFDRSLKSNLYAEEQMVSPLNRRSVNHIMTEEAVELASLSHHESRLLEMIKDEKGDELMRAFGYFKHHPELLRQPLYQFLFDLLISRLGVLQVQLEERKEIVEALKQFFNDALEGFNSPRDLETALFLVKVGERLRSQMNQEGQRAFIDFKAVIRDSLIPKARQFTTGRESAIKRLILHLVFSYHTCSWQTLSEAEKRQATIDLARYGYASFTDHSQKDQTIIREADAAWYLHEKEVKAAWERDPALRNEVMNTLLCDQGKDNLIGPVWRGNYPTVTNRNISLNLKNKTASIKVSLDLAMQEVGRFFPSPGRGVATGQRAFYFPDLDITIHFSKKERAHAAPYQITRKIEGKAFIFIPSEHYELTTKEMPIELEDDETLWMEKEHWIGKGHLACIKEGQVVWKMPFTKHSHKKNGVVYAFNWTDQVKRGIPVREVDLEKEMHQLGLLSWFADENEIKAYAYHDRPKQLAFIEFPGYGLSFQVKQVGSEQRAYLLDHDGDLFLSSTQKDQKLLQYGSYLLLKNAKGRKKVFIRTQSLESIMLDYCVRHLGKFKSSPLTRQFIESFTLNQQSHRPLLSFDLDEKTGELKAATPEGYAYLALFHFIQGDFKKSLHLVSLLEEEGRSHPFSKEVDQYLDLLSLPLLLNNSPEALEITLRLGALRTENQWMQHEESSKKEKVEEKALLKWLLLKDKYSIFLKTLKEGVPPILSPYQELFVLHELSRLSSKLIQQHLGKKDKRSNEETSDSEISRLRRGLIEDKLGKFAEKLGIEAAGENFLLSSKMIKRQSHLKRLLKADNEVKSFTQGLLTRILFSSEDKEKESSGMMRSAIQKATVLRDNQLIRSLFDSFEVRSFYEKVDERASLENVPTTLWEMSGETLSQYFPLYYRLAKNERAWGMDRTLFSKKRKEFLQALELSRGQYGKNEALKREILMTVSRSSLMVFFPSASKLEEAIARAKQNAANEVELQVLIEDLLKKCRYKRLSSAVVDPGNLTAGASRTERMMHRILSPFPGFILPFPARAYMWGRTWVSFLHALYTRDPALPNQTLWAGQRLIDYLSVCHAEKESLRTGLRILSWLPRGWSFSRAVRDETTQDKELSQAITARARSSLKKEQLEPQIAQLMVQKEEAINRVFEDLFATYFTAEEKPSMSNNQRVSAYQTTSEEETVKAVFNEVNQSLCHYYERPLETKTQIALKSGAKPQQFISEMLRIGHDVKTFLEAEEKAIEELARNRRKGEVDALLSNELKNKVVASSSLPFEQIYQRFVACDDETFFKDLSIQEEWKGELKTRLYLYQTVRRRFNLLFNQLENHPDDALALAQELKRRPAYRLDEAVPELALRAKLSYEVALEFMIHETGGQAKQLSRLLSSMHPKIVLEQIMGTGKTFLLPISDRVFADGEQLIFNIVIDAVAPSNFKSFIEWSRKAFNQIGTVFRFSRGAQWTKEHLWGMVQVLKRAIHLGEHLCATPKDMQALELRFLEEALDVQGKFEKALGFERKKRLQHFKEALQLLRQKGVENSDEKHKMDEPSKGILNFPLGRPQMMSQEEIEIINQVMLLLLTTAEFQNHITLKSKRPEALSQAVYREKIKPFLAKKVAALEFFGVPEREQAAFAQYLMGEAGEIPRWIQKSPHRRAIGEAKGLITLLLEHALQSVTNVEFAVSKKGNGEYVRPSDGNENPIENATILKADAAYVKTLMRLFQTRLSKEQLQRFLKFLHEQATKESKTLHIAPQRTQAGCFFAHHCAPFQIDTYQASDLPAIYDLLNASDQVMTTYASHFIAHQIRFYTDFLSSNFANFHSIFGKRQISRTGTPKNQKCYPQGTEMLTYLGTEGESVHILEKKLSHATSIQVLEESDPQKALEELIQRFFISNPRALAFIDLDPICNGMTPTAIKDVFLKALENSRKEIEGIVYFDEKKNLVVCERGSTHPSSFETCQIPKDKRVTIYDHTQTTGADVTQDEKAEAILSIGENITFTDLAQAFDRMRQARRGEQKITLVMTGRARQRMTGDPSHVPTIREVIAFALKNEGNKLAQEHFVADQYKMHDVLRRAVLDKALSAQSIDYTVKILRAFKDIFVRSLDEDPFEVYGHLDSYENPHVLLKKYQESLLKRAEKSWYFTRSELQSIKREMELIGRDSTYPQKVHLYKKKEIAQQAHHYLDQAAQAAHESEQEQEADVHADVNIHQMQHNMNAKSEMEGKVKRHAGWKWPSSLNLYDIDSYFHVTTPHAWLLPKPVPIYTIKDFIEKNPEIKALGSKMSDIIYVTENFAQQRDNRTLFKAKPVTPLSEAQTPLFKALVILDKREEQTKRKVLLLHKDEIAFWKQKLAEDRASHETPLEELQFALYDLENRVITATGKNPVTDAELREDKQLSHAFAKLRFMNGETSFTEEEKEVLFPWIQTHGPKFMRQLHQTLYDERPTGRYQGSAIDGLFYDAMGVSRQMRLRV